MSKVVAHVGVDIRASVDSLATEWKLGNADTVRRLVVLGLGGDLKLADELNGQMRMKRIAAEKFYKQKRQLGMREYASDGQHAPVISVRLPSNWVRSVKAAGGLRSVIELGLGKVK